MWRRLAQRRESEVEEGHLMVDHVHLMLSIPPPGVFDRLHQGEECDRSQRAISSFELEATSCPRWGGMSAIRASSMQTATLGLVAATDC